VDYISDLKQQKQAQDKNREVVRLLSNLGMSYIVKK
jgi:hypothetical protein